MAYKLQEESIEAVEKLLKILVERLLQTDMTSVTFNFSSKSSSASVTSIEDLLEAANLKATSVRHDIYQGIKSAEHLNIYPEYASLREYYEFRVDKGRLIAERKAPQFDMEVTIQEAPKSIIIDDACTTASEVLLMINLNDRLKVIREFEFTNVKHLLLAEIGKLREIGRKQDLSVDIGAPNGIKVRRI